MSFSVLISTHDLDLAGLLRDAFTGADYAVDLVTSGEELSDAADAVLLILTGGLRSEGAANLARQAREHLGIPVFGVVDPGVQDWRRLSRSLGLSEVFSSPADSHEILLLGRRLIERKHLQEITGIVGETDAIREALERVVQIAPVNSTVLITGESGTGKELVARGIHALSPRRHRAFIAVNVAALSETLLESELFGHEKGAFTGAIDSRRGLFELAHRGTIFLDEIGEMPLTTQTKLLRVLEQREFLRVGGEKPIRVDVRIIAATNQDLRQLVAIGDFRRDLYYRLNVLHIELPPLRQRTEDIPLLVDSFVEEVSSRHDRPFVGISDEAMEILKRHRWPGNVRELRNLVESMVVLAPGRRIEPGDIPDEVRGGGSSRLLPVPLGPPARAVESGERSDLRPELEFVFRTLVDLKVDMDELKREFEAYRRELQGLQEMGAPLIVRGGPVGIELHTARGATDIAHARILEARTAAGDPGYDGRHDSAPADEPPEEGVVVFRPGMTMEELEREAITAALDEVDGNRRKAAEMLGIGERTLYRKIRKFELD